MVNAAQVQATERFIFQLEKLGEVNAQLAFKKYSPLVNSGGISRESLYEELFNLNFKTFGRMGRLLYSAIATGVEKRYVDFAPADLDFLGARTNEVVQSTMTNLGGLYGINSVLKDYGMRELRTNVISNSETEVLIIANSSSCDFCQNREGQVAYSADISSHYGCACYVGKR